MCVAFHSKAAEMLEVSLIVVIDSYTVNEPIFEFSRNLCITETQEWRCNHIEISIYLSVMFSANQTRGLQRNVWEIKNTAKRFLSQLQPSEFASKVLCLVP